MDQNRVMLRPLCHLNCLGATSDCAWLSVVSSDTLAPGSSRANGVWQLYKHCLFELESQTVLWFEDSSVTIGALEMTLSRKNVYGRYCANFIIHLLIICNWRAEWNSSNPALFLTGELFCVSVFEPKLNAAVGAVTRIPFRPNIDNNDSCFTWKAFI